MSKVLLINGSPHAAGKMLINLDQITKISLVPDSSNRYALVLASSDKVVLVSAEDMSRVLARVQTFIQR